MFVQCILLEFGFMVYSYNSVKWKTDSVSHLPNDSSNIAWDMLLTRLRKNVQVNIKLGKVQSLWNILVLVNFNQTLT